MADTTNPRGGAAEARNPDYYCTAHRSDGEPCSNYRLRGLTVCRAHGGGTPASVAKVAGVAIAEIAAQAGIPEVRVQDFPKVAAELVGWHVRLFSVLDQELETLRLLHGPVAHAREYGDILDRLDKASHGITRLMNAAAAMRLSLPEERPKPPPMELLAAALAGIGERMDLMAGHCHTCTCGGDVVNGEVVAEAPPEAE